jgi:cytoskeletal protein CcmA (bactofilin family)
MFRGLLILSLTFAAPLIATAAELRVGDRSSVSADEQIGENLYIAGGTVTSAGSVLKDMLAAGGSVLVNGDIAADFAALGGSIGIFGPVAGDALAIGGNVHLGGPVGGDVLLAGGVVRVDAPVKGDLTLAAADAYINAPVGGNVTIEADTLTLGSKADIAGALTYRAASEARIEQGAKVRGETFFTPRADIRQGLKQGIITFLSFWFIVRFLMLLAGALFFGLIFKRYSEELVKRSLMEPVPGFLAGLVTVIVLPIVSGILIATLVGVPLGIIGFLALMIGVVFAHLIAPVLLGSMLAVWLFKKTGEVSWKTILLGVVVFYIAGFIPFVGWIARGFFVLLAIGATLRFKIQLAKPWL